MGKPLIKRRNQRSSVKGRCDTNNSTDRQRPRKAQVRSVFGPNQLLLRITLLPKSSEHQHTCFHWQQLPSYYTAIWLGAVLAWKGCLFLRSGNPESKRQSSGTDTSPKFYVPKLCTSAPLEQRTPAPLSAQILKGMEKAHSASSPPTCLVS